MTIAAGSAAPSFQLLDQNKSQVSLSDLAGRKSLVVFIPFPFTGICEGELCMIRDQRAQFTELDANVVAVTCDTVPANKKWAEDNGFDFPVLSDFWPHGETAKAYGAFNDQLGVANRYTFVLDGDGVIREVINTESLGVAREFDEYVRALTAI